MIRVLVSSCLLGEPVRYHGGDASCDEAVLRRWVEQGRVVPFCPEVAAGLGVPRPAAEIRGGDGLAVLEGRAEVVTRDGACLTEALVRGSKQALDMALRQGARLAVLTESSPSCGSESVYDGTFSGKTRSGSGVTSALLERNGIRVFPTTALEEAQAYLETLEAESVRAPATS